jgi:hypothetical protein
METAQFHTVSASEKQSFSFSFLSSFICFNLLFRTYAQNFQQFEETTIRKMKISKYIHATDSRIVNDGDPFMFDLQLTSIN